MTTNTINVHLSEGIINTNTKLITARKENQEVLC